MAAMVAASGHSRDDHGRMHYLRLLKRVGNVLIKRHVASLRGLKGNAGGVIKFLARNF
jgi:hypothetical protein